MIRIVESKEVYRCRVFGITEDVATDGEGFEIRKSIVRHRGAAVMLAVDDTDRVLLIRQYRIALDGYLWELPAGTVDPGETPSMTARRELVEETGYSAGTWRKIGEFYPSPGCMDEKMTIFLATDLTRGVAQPMADERIETKWFTRDQVARMIRSKKIVDAKTLVAWLHWNYLGDQADADEGPSADGKTGVE